MANTIRTDLGWFFASWLVLANGLWLATPWVDQWATWMGPAWIWCAAIPGTILLLLFPARALILALAITAAPMVLAICAAQRRRRLPRRYLPQF